MTTRATHFKKVLPYAFLFFGYGFLFAQDTILTETPSIETILEANPILMDIQTPALASATNSGSVYIHQIGADNQGNVLLRGRNNEVQLMQYGNANRADIRLSGKSVVHHTLQYGDGNQLFEYGNASNLDLERSILQNGNNQNISIFGSNSLTQNLRLNVQGNAESITIRNFN